MTQPSGFCPDSFQFLKELSSLIVRENLPETLWLNGKVIDKIERLAREAMPLLTFQDPQR